MNYKNMSTSRVLELSPSNKTTDNKYAYKLGVAQVTFDIPEGNYLLDPSSLRIAGGLRLYTTGSTAPTGQLLSMSSRLGVYSCFRSLIWRSGKYHTIISQENHYNRWLSTYLPLQSSTENALSFMSATALTMPNYEVFKDSVVEKASSNEFCVHLPCGITNSGQSLNLMPNALGGCQLTIMLESDASALQVLPADNTTAPDTSTLLDAYYELDNVVLICSVITPAVDELSRLMKATTGSMTFQSIHNFYDTANSTNIQISLNLGLKKCKSLFTSWISSNKLNNLGADSFATLSPTNLDGTLAPIKRLTWLKGGRAFNKLYPVDTNFNTISNTISEDVVLTEDYLNSVASFDKNMNVSANVSNVNRGWVGGTSGFGTPYQLVNDSGVVWGLGLNYENYLGGSGIALDKENFGLSIECDLTTSNAQSIFIFANAESQIVWNENGVQLIQ